MNIAILYKYIYRCYFIHSSVKLREKRVYMALPKDGNAQMVSVFRQPTLLKKAHVIVVSLFSSVYSSRHHDLVYDLILFTCFWAET